MSFFTSLMDSFEGEGIRMWMQTHVDIPAVLSVLYLFVVLYLPNHVMKDRPAMNLKRVNQVWNLLLTVFSVMGSYYCVPRLYELLTAERIGGLAQGDQTERLTFARGGSKTGGGENPVIAGSLYTSICVWNRGMFYMNGVGFWVTAFILSKIPEMFDTVLLVLQKKPVIFLHWYHHVTVMLYCWHAYVSVISSGLWFATMNYCVHSIMYFYYFICAMGYRGLVRPFAPLITSLQILQMMVGLFVTTFSFYHSYLTDQGCDVDRTNIRLGLLMYFSYFLLFSQLFINNYMKKSSSPKAAANGSASAKKVK